MDLLALADFTLVARHGGFGAASRAARRPKATLSRRVGELEAALAVRLTRLLLDARARTLTATYLCSGRLEVDDRDVVVIGDVL